METRTSAPVRFVRVGAGVSGGEAAASSPSSSSSGLLWGESTTLAGFFPEEGAGYAGGIASAAVDGVRAVEGVLASLGVKAAGVEW